VFIIAVKIKACLLPYNACCNQLKSAASRLSKIPLYVAGHPGAYPVSCDTCRLSSDPVLGGAAFSARGGTGLSRHIPVNNRAHGRSRACAGNGPALGCGPATAGFPCAFPCGARGSRQTVCCNRCGPPKHAAVTAFQGQLCAMRASCTLSSDSSALKTALSCARILFSSSFETSWS